MPAIGKGSSAISRRPASSAAASTDESGRDGPRPGRQEHHPSRTAARRAGPGHQLRGRRAHLARCAVERPRAAPARRRDVAPPTAERAHGSRPRPSAPAQPDAGLRQLRNDHPPPARPARGHAGSAPPSPATRLFAAVRCVGSPSRSRRWARGSRSTAATDCRSPFAAGGLEPIRYAMPVSSAQIKSALLLAGLVGEVAVDVLEPRGPLPRPHRAHAPRLRLRRGGARGVDRISSGRTHRAVRDPGARRSVLRRVSRWRGRARGGG